MKQKAKIEIKRIMSNPEIGLSDLQVQGRYDAKLTNKTKKVVGKSYPEIFIKNFVSFFNLFVLILAVLLIYCEKYMSLMFAIIYSANLFIGLAVDIRSHKLMKKLKIITQENVEVIRNGFISTISVDDIVLDDIIVLKTGNQIPIDGFVVSNTIGVNESNLTGESLMVYKKIGDKVYSGSYVVSGEARIRVDKVGKDSYINQLEKTAKGKKSKKTEIKNSLDWFFRIIIIAVIIVTGLGVWALYPSLVENFKSSFGTFAGTLISMIPAGLYLLSSLTLTLGVINLSKRRAMVQDMYSIETLARSNVLCLDKTGTITDGTMEVKEIIPLGIYKKENLISIISSLVASTNDDNATARAIKQAFPFEPDKKAIYACPFNSENKYSFAVFARTTYVMGALECLNALNHTVVKSQVDNYTSKGFRVLVVAKNSYVEMGKKLNNPVEVVGLIVLQDHIKPDAKETLKWFTENNVAIRIISGDNALTVSEIARQVGVPNSEKCISLEGLSIEEVKKIAPNYVVFGRVSPEQKEAIIDSLKQEGHTVAMTGDGVNDILALKKADCSIAMANGSDAAKNVSQLIMMDSNFSSLPNVVAEGRRVINNLQRTCSLFLVKTVFATVIALLFIVLLFTGLTKTFPYETNQLYLWEFTIIGLGSFFIALEPNSEIIKPGFISIILKKAIPGAFMIIVSTIIIYALYALETHGIMYTGIFTDEQFKTILFIVFSLLPLVHFYIVCTPFSKIRIVVFSAACVFNIGMLVGAFFMQKYVFVNSEVDLVKMLFGINFNSLIGLNYLQAAITVFVCASVFLLCLFVVYSVNNFIKGKRSR